MNSESEEKPATEARPQPPIQSSPCSYYCNISKMLKKLGLNISILNKRTPFCKHEIGCLNNILSGTIQSFAIGYIIKTAINLLSVFAAFKKLTKQYIYITI